MKTTITMKMRDGSVWGVPVADVAINRAEYYASEFGGDLKRSLDEDTLPLFENDEYEIEDWAYNNMNWSDFAAPTKISDSLPLTEEDFGNAWADSDTEKEII